MDAQEVIRQTKEVLKIGELRKTINNNKYLYHTKYDIYDQIVKLDKNKLSICPQGGGFVKSVDITNKDFLKDVDDGIITFVKNIPLEYKKVKLFHDHWLVDNSPIGFDGNLPLKHFIEGYTTIQKWNGWSVPMVELDQIEKFNEIQKKTLDSEPTSIFKIIDEDSIQIKMFDEDDWIGIEAEYIDVNGQTKKVFDISLGWTWSEEDIND